ncbi:MAG: hypothetical protein ACXVYY_00990 [Oryzihumus sp.]
MLEEIESLLDYFRAPVSVHSPASGSTVRFTLPERVAEHLNPTYVPSPRTPLELEQDVQRLRAQLALTSHEPAASGGWCGTCFESWPCEWSRKPVS